MTFPDVHALLLGLGAGLLASLVFFFGLAWGIRQALAARRPALVLVSSFVCRSALLVGLAVVVARLAQPLWALAGYALAFMVVRALALRLARHGDGWPLVGRGGG